LGNTRKRIGDIDEFQLSNMSR